MNQEDERDLNPLKIVKDWWSKVGTLEKPTETCCHEPRRGSHSMDRPIEIRQCHDGETSKFAINIEGLLDIESLLQVNNAIIFAS